LIKSILAILNSKLIGYYFKFKFSEFDTVFPKAKIGQCKLLPIKKTDNTNVQTFKSLNIEANNLIILLEKEYKASIDFIKLLQVSFSGLKLTKKLENWHELTFSDLRKELEKQQLHIPLKERLEWQTKFEGQQTALLALRTQIHATDAAIDRLVYVLYDLTQEEIALVEGVPK
jgi:hypothetical protein